MKSHPMGLAGGLLALFVSMIWGGNIAALKFGLATFPPMWSAFWRFASAVIAVVVWGKLQGVRLWPERGEWGPLTVLGLMFTGQIALLNTGTGLTSAGYAVVLLNAHPIFTNLFGHFVASEQRLNARRALGLALAFAGICWVAAGRPDLSLAPRPILGNILMVVSASLLAARVIYTRRIIQGVHPLRPVVWQMVLCLPIFGAAGLISEQPTLQPVSWEAVAAILYQGVLVAGFCFVIWTNLLKKHSAGTLSMFGFTVPFFGVILSALLFGETIPARLLIGAGLVTAGIVIVTRQARPRPEAEPAK